MSLDWLYLVAYVLGLPLGAWLVGIFGFSDDEWELLGIFLTAFWPLAIVVAFGEFLIACARTGRARRDAS